MSDRALWNTNGYWSITPITDDTPSLEFQIESNYKKLIALIDSAIKSPTVTKTTDSTRLEWFSNACLISITVTNADFYKWEITNYVHLSTFTGETFYLVLNPDVDKVLYQYFKK